MRNGNRRHSRFHSLVIAGLMVPVLGCHEAGQTDAGKDAPVIAADSLFQPVSVIALRTSADDPIGSPSDVVVTPEALTVVDGRQANVKVFDRGGTLIHTISRPGDGPGEMRGPVSAIALDGGRLLVADRRRSVLTWWDTSGTLLNEELVPGSWTGLMRLPGSSRLLLVGRHTVADSAGEDDVFVLHEVDETGRIQASYRPFVLPSKPLQQSFSGFYAAAIGPFVVSGAYTSNEIEFHDRRTGADRSVAIGGPWYHAPEWPSKSIPGGVAGVDAWAHRQVLLIRLHALEKGRLLAEFLAYNEAGDRLFRYAVADTTGRELVSTTPTPFEILRTAGDTAYGVVVDSMGATTLRTAVVRD